jgi:hypothetical protein
MKKSQLKQLIREVISEITYGNDPARSQADYRNVIDQLTPEYGGISAYLDGTQVGDLDDLLMKAYELGKKDGSFGKHSPLPGRGLY